MADRAKPVNALLALACAGAVLVACAPNALAQRLRDRSEIKQLDGVDLEERIGDQVPLDIPLIDSTGKTVTLGDQIGDRPTVLALVYYDCPVVCSLVMDRLSESMNDLDYTVGEDYSVVIVSFDPTETTQQAAERKLAYLSGYTQPVTPQTQAGWTFHTASADSIRQITQGVGFNIQLLDNGEYSHPVGLAVLAPDGTISRYMYGFDYPPKQLKLSLLDASEGKIAQSLGDRFLHFCYRYDPNAGAYSMEAMLVMRIGAIATVIVLTFLIGGLLLFERTRRHRKAQRPTSDTPSGTLAMGHAT
ncbi:MAG: photosynthetic protein synthase I [Phycisphaeraceae bacterium]|nr:MAG: photosynthetic protein synthase I [Phycisphaeraceae bacterium]